MSSRPCYFRSLSGYSGVVYSIAESLSGKAAIYRDNTSRRRGVRSLRPARSGPTSFSQPAAQSVYRPWSFTRLLGRPDQQIASWRRTDEGGGRGCVPSRRRVISASSSDRRHYHPRCCCYLRPTHVQCLLLHGEQFDHDFSLISRL